MFLEFEKAMHNNSTTLHATTDYTTLTLTLDCSLLVLDSIALYTICLGEMLRIHLLAPDAD
jgi:hypothetical protein